MERQPAQDCARRFVQRTVFLTQKAIEGRQRAKMIVSNSMALQSGKTAVVQNFENFPTSTMSTLRFQIQFAMPGIALSVFRSSTGSRRCMRTRSGGTLCFQNFRTLRYL